MNLELADLARELGSDTLFDEGVEAARNACVAGASIASAAIAAAAWYDNPLTGVPALLACMSRVSALPFEPERWALGLRRTTHPDTLDPDFTPGFGFVDRAQASYIIDAAARLAAAREGSRRAPWTSFLLAHRGSVERESGPLNHAGLAALLFLDHGLDADAAERTFLAWRIETAIEQAQRARRRGLAAFPFFSECYLYDGERPPEQPLDLAALRQRLGLDGSGGAR